MIELIQKLPNTKLLNINSDPLVHPVKCAYQGVTKS